MLNTLDLFGITSHPFSSKLTTWERGSIKGDGKKNRAEENRGQERVSKKDLARGMVTLVEKECEANSKVEDI